MCLFTVIGGWGKMHTPIPSKTMQLAIQQNKTLFFGRAVIILLKALKMSHKKMNIFPENKASFDSFLLTRNQKKNLTTVMPPWPKKDVSITNILSLKDKISVFDFT